MYLVIAGLLSACSTIPQKPSLDANNQQAVSEQIVVKRDDYKKQTEFIGPNIAPDKLFDLLFIRAWKSDGSDRADYQIYVMDHYYGEWRFYNSTWDSKGQQLDTIEISRDVDTCRYRCSFNEHVGINISHAYLDRNKDSGVNFKISGKAGEETFYIPSGYIKGFLSKIGEQTEEPPDLNKPVRDKLIGKWAGPAKNSRGESGTVTFNLNSDNSFFGSADVGGKTYWSFSGSWEVKNKRLLWTYKKSTPTYPGGERMDMDEIVSLDADNLVLLNSSGERDTYVRQK